MTSALDSRSKDILMSLLNSNNPRTAKDLGNQFGLTQREVYYWVRKIDLWLDGEDIYIERKPGSGMVLVCPQEKKKNLQIELEKLKGYSLILKPIERQRYLITALLTEEQPILTKSLALSLGVSRPTIFDDLKFVENWLSKFNIRLVRKRGSGFTLSGSETDYRKAIESILIDIIGEVGLLSLHQGNFFRPFQTNNENKVQPYQGLQTFEPQDLPFCCDLVGIIEEKSNYYFSDSSYLSMILFFSILLERVRKGKFIREALHESEKIRSTSEYAIANEIASLISRRLSSDLDDLEQDYIAIRIMGLKKRQSASTYNFKTKTMVRDDEIENIVHEIIEEASKYLHPILTIDQKLFQGLLIHIKPVTNRLYFGLSIKNFLLDEIKNQYPYIFMIAEKTSKVIEKHLGRSVPEDEIGFIAMHLGAAMERLRVFSSKRKKNVLVVCGGGCATAWMLVSRIQAEFPEVNVVDVKSMMELTADTLAINQVDFVVTTVSLEMIDKPVIMVSPLLGDSDINKIREYLDISSSPVESIKVQKENSDQSIANLLTQEFIQTRLEAGCWQDVVDQTCKPLLDAGLIRMRYIEAIKELLERHGPYMVISPGVVLLHAMIGDGVNALCMSLATLDPPVCFGHKKNDPVSMAIVFGTIDNRSHLRALGQLAKMLGEKDFITPVADMDSKQDVYNHLQKFAENK